MTRIDAHLVAAGKYHDIDFARLELLKLLAEHPQIRTTVAHDYADTARIAACRFLVTYTCDLLPSPEQTEAIHAWLEGGGRWLALHGTNSILAFTDQGVATPEERPDAVALLGTQFKAHPPIGPFRVEIVDRADPVTAGLDDFDVVDELYLSKTTAPIRIVAQSRFEGQAPGFVDAEWPDTRVPIVYYRDIGRGGVLYNTLGHCRGHWDVPELLPFWEHPERCAWAYPVYHTLLRRGLAWAMGD